MELNEFLSETGEKVFRAIWEDVIIYSFWLMIVFAGALGISPGSLYYRVSRRSVIYSPGERDVK